MHVKNIGVNRKYLNESAMAMTKCFKILREKWQPYFFEMCSTSVFLLPWWILWYSQPMAGSHNKENNKLIK